MPAPYRIQVGDLIDVLVWSQAKLSTQVRVRPDGRVTLPLLGDVAVRGLTPEGAARELVRRLDGLVVDPQVTVGMAATREQTYSVVGEVRSPGTFPLRDGDGVLHAIAGAGGMGDFATDDAIFVLRREAQPPRIRFRYAALTGGAGKAREFRLRDGDIVVVE